MVDPSLIAPDKKKLIMIIFRKSIREENHIFRYSILCPAFALLEKLVKNSHPDADLIYETLILVLRDHYTTRITDFIEEEILLDGFSDMIRGVNT